MWTFTLTMQIIIKTGFEKVTHNVDFHPNSQAKGQSLVESGHVRDVHEFREDGKSYLIDSRIVKQTAVSSTPYSAKLFVWSSYVIIFNFIC